MATKKKQFDFYDEVKAEYTKMWTRNGKTDQHMVDWCMGEVSNAIKLANGLFFIWKKPRIEKNFPVAEGMAREMDEAVKICSAISKSEQHFLDANLKDMRHELEYYEGVEPLYFKKAEVYGGINLNICTTCIKRGIWDNDDSYKLMDAADRVAIANGQKLEIEKFDKRLRTYLKRYGLSQVRTWTYWDME